jgi:hypothetical protein
LKLSKKENLRRSGVSIEREGEGQVCRMRETMRGGNGVQEFFFFSFLIKKKKTTNDVKLYIMSTIIRFVYNATLAHDNIQNPPIM